MSEQDFVENASENAAEEPAEVTSGEFSKDACDRVNLFWFGFTQFSRKTREEKRRSLPAVDGDCQTQWLRNSDYQDTLVRKQFGAFHAHLSQQDPEKLYETLPRAEDVVAAIVVLDQFSRHIFRDEAEAFAQDALARNICKRALLGGVFERVEHPLVVLFGLMPLMHSEEKKDQVRVHSLLERLAMSIVDADPAIPSVQASIRAAVEHKKVIDTFGRFPKRNPALGRTSSAKEKQHQRTEGSV